MLRKLLAERFNDPANECLVTGLFRIASVRSKILSRYCDQCLVLVFLQKPEEFFVFA
jgi:hypothetical protein